MPKLHAIRKQASDLGSPDLFFAQNDENKIFTYAFMTKNDAV